MPLPIYRLTDDQLQALIDDPGTDEQTIEEAQEELDRRADEAERFPVNDTPSLDRPWWKEEV